MTVKPTQLTIDLPIDYYSQAETIGITQYVTEQARKYFDNIDSYEIRIKDGNTPRALISKSKEDKEPQVHIYNINIKLRITPTSWVIRSFVALRQIGLMSQILRLSNFKLFNLFLLLRQIVAKL